MSILTVRLSPVPLPIGLRICCVGFIKPIKLITIPANIGEHGVMRNSLNISNFLYPQFLNAADKSYLEMIRDIPLQYDLENPVVELKFQSELFKIVKHYDSLTISD